MTRDHLRRATGRTMLVLLAASMAVLAPAAPAMANQAKGIFAVFDQCQTKNPEVSSCIVVRTSGGKIGLGTAKVAINQAITLQGGEDGSQEKFVGAENGETLSKTPLTVPGGLPSVVAVGQLPPTALVEYNKVVKAGMTNVTATLELVGNPNLNLGNLLQQEEVALSLPLRAHLENTFLGSECYIGSQASPITLELTTGTTKPPKPIQPISGAAGELEGQDEFQLLTIANNRFVDNAFTEPAAEGCGGILASEVDPTVNSQLALSSLAGQTTAVLESTVEVATAQAVIASE
jgi:hypothetical protein